MAPIVLLGPQRHHPTVADTLAKLGIEGDIAVISAGWQEREAETEELQEHCGRPLLPLELYRRYDGILADDTELALALRARQERLRQLQELYRVRLDHALEPARVLLRREAHGGFLDEHRRAAIRAVRTLDRQHVQRIKKLHREFDAEWRPQERPRVAEERRELAAILAKASAVVVAGGHVAVLATRLRLLAPIGLADPPLPVIAWSAGAMVLSERIVLFHDSPPQGAGNAEVLEPGFGLFTGVVPLPHAETRLRLDDPVRVALFARRFSPATCVVLTDGARLARDRDRWIPGLRARVLGRGGRLRRMVVRR